MTDADGPSPALTLNFAQSEMTDGNPAPTPTRSFEEALLCGEAKGFAVCAKPLRFARLPDTVATTFAEIGDDGCYYIFQSEAEATKRLAQVTPEDRLGWIFSVREAAYFANAGKNDGPKLDFRGHPFQMRGFIVDLSEAVTEWRHPGKLGWRGPTVATADMPPMRAGEPQPSRMQRMVSWVRGLLNKNTSNQTSAPAAQSGRGSP